ncbi:endonuclease domain-containing 1 protein-like [Notechis scutatus]|uniref:Endonuclease domain-containing 1 protein-like n=1 Tax=Notechis scutatus TaxID=8663 RepID=A0A6J1W4X5_9SAUR|nr:endonuclease domain-containing 1 protein-like [Notechis scutatus]
MNPARICQFYRNRYEFATMYDKDLRIPLFSAYKYRFEDSEAQKDWMIEPQLAMPWDQQRKNMESEQDSGIDPKELAKGQAVLKDYAGTLSYIKGQLAPFSHQLDQDSKDATFTLTNVVPQFKDLANGYWKQYISNMRKDADGCSETYVITGVVPGEDSISEGRVNKPSYIWTAVCCVYPNLHKTSW